MSIEHKPSYADRMLRYAVPVVAVAMLSACVEQPQVRTVAVAPPPPPPRLFVYPANGQSPDQLERDRYECHTWAVQQTGVDPSRPGAPSYARVVVAPAPGTGTVTGAIGGAILGSLIAGPRAAGVGALFGGATGAIVGSAADAQAQQTAQQEAQMNQQQINQQRAAEMAGAQSYRRAISACLTARGYTVS
jgi:outer membrane lipoprotein SlyB